MTTMISQALATDGTWTAVANGPIVNILLTGSAGNWEIIVATSLPDPTASGMPVTSLDGAWSSSVLASNENVYARSFGGSGPRALLIRGMKN